MIEDDAGQAIPAELIPVHPLVVPRRRDETQVLCITNALRPENLRGGSRGT